jgi:predicted glutamine amidotransferase
MCRWAAYLGEPVYLEEIVSAPCHSLIAQSQSAQEAKTSTNADGFGIAWYGDRAEPGLYRDILPAWSDQNLKSLCRQIRSGLFLAHVRASTGGATSRSNCHPFVSGRWSFMHNGQIGGFEKIRRRLENGISDELYDQRLGTTDSELFFLMLLQHGLDRDPLLAVRKAVRQVTDRAAEAGIERSFKLTAAFSDGRSLHAVRYSSQGQAPTLYMARTRTGYCLVSEPFDRDGCSFESIPASSFVTITAEGVTVREFRAACDLAVAV